MPPTDTGKQRNKSVIGSKNRNTRKPREQDVQYSPENRDKGELNTCGFKKGQLGENAFVRIHELMTAPHYTPQYDPD